MAQKNTLVCAVRRCVFTSVCDSDAMLCSRRAAAAAEASSIDVYARGNSQNPFHPTKEFSFFAFKIQFCWQIVLTPSPLFRMRDA